MKPVSKKFLLAFLVILLSVSNLFAQERTRVAVMPFEAGKGVSKPEAKYLTERVRSGLINTNIFDVISNDQLQTMIEVKRTKLEIGSGSCTSDKCIIDLGNALECEKMIVGSAAGAFGEYTISAKIVDVVKQKYELAKEVTISNKNQFPDAARTIVRYIIGDEPPTFSHFGMIWRNFAIPGWGHIYANQDRGFIYGGLWLSIGGAFLWSHFNYNTKQDAYLTADYSNIDAKYNDSKDAYMIRGYLSFAFIAVYLASISDIFLTGTGYMPGEKEQVSKRIKYDFYFGSNVHKYEPMLKRDDRTEFKISWRY